MQQGFIYCPKGEHWWEENTFMTPHARFTRPDVIRIYGGVRDQQGVSRIKYIDVDAMNPGNVLNISDSPCFDVGNPGCFDDNGVILGDIIDVDKKLYMYYVGFQHVEKVKFFAFSGLAISDDDGCTFKRYSEVPIMDRTTTARYGRCIHTVLYEKGLFRCYYAVINDWKIIDNVPYPVYDIWYTESEDGVHFPNEDKHLCIGTSGDEYRIGRPKVYKLPDGTYEMYYTRDLVTKQYLAGYATSEDGIHWKRCDYELRLRKSGESWDKEMACYPVKIVTSNNTYLIYNGNGMGRDGIGYMRL